MLYHAEVVSGVRHDGLEVLAAVAVLLPRNHVRVQREVRREVLEILYKKRNTVSSAIMW